MRKPKCGDCGADGCLDCDPYPRRVLSPSYQPPDSRIQTVMSKRNTQRAARRLQAECGVKYTTAYQWARENHEDDH